MATVVMQRDAEVQHYDRFMLRKKRTVEVAEMCSRKYLDLRGIK
jgi:hypothetical protein